MMEMWWEASDNPAFAAYRCYWTQTPVFRRETIVGYVKYKMRLPYRADMYQRWLERSEAEARAIVEDER